MIKSHVSSYGSNASPVPVEPSHKCLCPSFVLQPVLLWRCFYFWLEATSLRDLDFACFSSAAPASFRAPPPSRHLRVADNAPHPTVNLVST